MQQQRLPHEEDALAEERMQLHRERLALQQDRERFAMEFQLHAPRRYRFFAWLTDLWAAWLAARLLSWAIPVLDGGTWFLMTYFLISVWMTGQFGQSLGKMAFELRVAGSDGQPAGWTAVLLRETVGRFVTFVTLFGLVFPFFNEKQKTIHDLMASTVVISSAPIEKRYVRRGMIK